MARSPLEPFREHLRSLGLQEGSIDLYCCHVRRSLAQGPVERLLDASLAPKTRRACLAALRAWARFNEDEKLLKHLGKMKLPRPDRLSPKVPLDRESWDKLGKQIDSMKKLEEPVRATLGLISTRGFRVGDVLRLKVGEVREALTTAILAFTAKGARRLTYRAKNFLNYLENLASHKSWKVVADLISPDAEAGPARHKAAVRRIERELRRVAVAAKLDPSDMHPHRLRRTAAVYFLKEMQGDPEAIIKLKEWMQWADINTAMGYVDHIRGDELASVEDRMMKKK